MKIMIMDMDMDKGKLSRRRNQQNYYKIELILIPTSNIFNK